MDFFIKNFRSHSLVYRNDKAFTYERITLFITLSLAIILYDLIVDNSFPIFKTIGYLSIFIVMMILLLDYIIFPFLIVPIFGQGINGIWEGEFLIKEPQEKILKIKKFEVLDFGRKCLITIETEMYKSTSVVAKLTTKDENSVELKFIYEVNHYNSDRSDHFGMTSMIFYKNGLLPKGEYYTRDNYVLRHGLVKLTKKLK